ncbi:hypothetical protein Kpol_2000p43 [Vanderwaltozyma polyspora DSM 70294]|uniref:Ubiquinone biosynthesis monooxygenase COQ6, mitochondrial n=1 Tax=Vanderwaltozyma polyspora (strain ATCC 22028 / DSM 70294 / BCRC 21397 / CBS 2163 / NBRC 10782 / NRRL Y-8283 / UCD 57-17) TaxID=436907 RepID=A7TF53_VANPO|nr:uncharacterized protein Kpol_2000p43 [Vanderwaltozyma polyspora DSM 70294]EDO19078.1 hypothetical protein Kpol_2000p43 [Vanderwaltozyma polyspora DSM 70294]
MMLVRSRIVWQRFVARGFATGGAKVKSPQLADVLIVGGGPAGLTLAAAIKASPALKHFKTVLVDGGDIKDKVGSFYDSPPENYTNRVVSLTPPSLDFIKSKVGINLMEDRMMVYDGVYVTDGCSNGTIDMEKDGISHMVEILNVQSSALKRLTDLQLGEDSFKLIDKTKVASIKYSDPNDATSWPIVTLEDGQAFKTRLLVGADGFNSPVRAFSGIQSRGWFYNEFGIVATMKLEYPPYKVRGWQRFLPTGPIAHLPLPDDNATLVWTHNDETTKLLVSLTPEAFTAMVNAAFVLDNADMQYYYNKLKEKSITDKDLIEDIDSRIQQVFDNLENESDIDECYPTRIASIIGESRARFPMKMFHADTYCAERIALLGDAAHTTHPLAGQGLNMGEGDTEALVNALEKATYRGLDIGSLLALQPFWADRYSTNTILLGIADKCHKLYGTDFAPMVGLRTIGANFINNFSPIKDLITNTLGTSAREPIAKK